MLLFLVLILSPKNPAESHLNVMIYKEMLLQICNQIYLYPKQNLYVSITKALIISK